METSDQYDGDAGHDMWVDFDFHESTGELSEFFDNSNLHAFVDNPNDLDLL